MDSIADMGGTEGWGPVRAPTPDEPVFAEAWEGRAFALAAFTMGRVSGQNLDAAVSDIATQLDRLGDTDSLDARRARALGLLAHPQEALDLVAHPSQTTESTESSSPRTEWASIPGRSASPSSLGCSRGGRHR